MQVLKVSAEYVQHALRGLAERTDPSAHTIWVHFGVDGTASSFKLEVGLAVVLVLYLTRARQRSHSHEDVIAEYLHCQAVNCCKILVFMPVPTQRRAFNQADFRVPDEAGWQPHHEAIDSTHSLNHTLRSTLPLDELAGGDAAARAATCTTCVAVVPAERRANVVVSSVTRSC